jgi:hypothetical protein
LREEIDVHKVEERYNVALRNLKEDKAITAVDRELILSFIRDLQAENLTTLRLTKYVYALRQIAKALKKSLDTVNHEDLRSFVAALKIANRGGIHGVQLSVAHLF